MCQNKQGSLRKVVSRQVRPVQAVAPEPSPLQYNSSAVSAFDADPRSFASKKPASKVVPSRWTCRAQESLYYAHAFPPPPPPKTNCGHSPSCISFFGVRAQCRCQGQNQSMGGEKTSSRMLSGACFVSTGLPGTSLSDYFFISLCFYLYHVHRHFFFLGFRFYICCVGIKISSAFWTVINIMSASMFLPEALWTIYSLECPKIKNGQVWA